MKATNGGRIPFENSVMFSSMRPLYSLLDYQHSYMDKDNDDKVVVIVGNTGSGKSTLLKHIYHHWQVKLLKRPESIETAKFFCHTDQDWAEALKESKDKPLNMISHDEAVNILYSKEAITKKNREINKLFSIIRGKRFYHIMCIPKIWRLDRELREDRVKGLINVFKWGSVRYMAYYNARKISYLFKELEVMRKTYKDSEHDIDIMKAKTLPTFCCRFPDYTGFINEMYDTHKEENMNNAIDQVYSAITESTEKKESLTRDRTKPLTPAQKRVYDLFLQGKKGVEIAKEMNISVSVVSASKKAIYSKGYDL